MRSIFRNVITFLLLFFCSIPPGQVCSQSAMSSRTANYKMVVKLDPETKTVTGYEILHWFNRTGNSTRELHFHLYLNAFKNNKTTLMQESGKRFQQSFARENAWGEIRIDTLQLLDGPDLTDKIEFIAPDDSNAHDETVFRIPLPQAVQPRQSQKLKIHFTAKLPKLTLRTGYADDFFMVAQWFPKIGVFENERWNCHQFHRNSEFYADFGVYDVQITLPEKYVVAAVGQEISRQRTPGGQILRFLAEDVHDFAWCASPDFQIATDQFGETKLKFYHMPWHQHLVPQILNTVKQSLKTTDTWFGLYPYPTLSFLCPPTNAIQAGGMEYPTLFTIAAFGFLPEEIRLAPMIAIHEFSHNYWYGMVASNEFEEPWLDEGFTTYTEIKLMESLFGPNANLIQFPWLEADDRSLHRISYLAHRDAFPLASRAWDVPAGDYSNTFYNKSALFLLTLENYLGPEQMQTVLREYFRRWKFRHPRTADFVAVVNEVTGQNRDWFFDPFLYEAGAIDYAVTEIISHEVPSFAGLNPADTTAADSGSFYSRVRVERLADGRLPVEILVTFSSGRTVRENWDGQAKCHFLTYQGSDQVISAEVDPERKIQLDRQFSNNSRTVEFQGAGVNRFWLKILFWIQNALLLTTGAG